MSNILNTDFVVPNTFNEKANFTSVDFGERKPLLTSELNELQSILNSNRTLIIDSIFGSGILGVGTMTYQSGTFNIANEKAIIKGELLNIKTQSISLSEGNSVYLTAWYEEVTGDSSIKEYGNAQTNTTVTNQIEDDRYGETSHRKQLMFNLSKVEMVGKLNLKLGVINGGKFIRQCNTIDENVAVKLPSKKIGIVDALNLFTADNVEDALAELMQTVIDINTNLTSIKEHVKGSFLSIDDTMDSFLQDVVIHGNTIQNPQDLTDIKNVGDKQGEQELYEIPIEITGKNLTKLNIVKSIISQDTGELGESNDYFSNISYDYVKPNKQLNISSNVTIDKVFYYDGNKKFISALTIERNNKTITTPNNCYYVRYRFLANNKPSWVQLEYGTQATQFEEYVSDQINILSPVPLDGLKGLSDDIICKDGVWGVQKNILDYLITGKENWSLNHSMTSCTAFFTKDIPNVKSNITPIMSGFKQNSNYSVDEQGTFSSDTNAIYITMSNEQATNPTMLKTWLTLHNTLVKYPTTEPKFIPLPDDQQLILRTFAPHTNIQFLCKTSGVIEAEVSKSLGAVVETNVKTIDNVSDNLNSIKYLEESENTVTTVDDGDILIHHTRNGYLGDIKVQGKTRVNIIPLDPSKWRINGEGINACYSIRLDSLNIEPDTKYSYKLFNLPNKYKTHVFHLVEPSKVPDTEGTFTSLSEIGSSFLHIYPKEGETFTLEDVKNVKAVLVKGDVPIDTYFEGMKSVGEDVEEINLTSVNPYTNFCPNKFEIGGVNSNTGADYNNNNYARTLYFNLPKGDYKVNIPTMTTTPFNLYLYEGETFKRAIVVKHGSVISLDASYKVRMEMQKSGGVTPEFLNTLKVVINLVNIPYTEAYNLKDDTKKLLYHDPTDKAWKKPVLREFDTVEKTITDNKYKYTVGSLELTINGSENWILDATLDKTLRCYLRVPNIYAGEVVCDKFTSIENYGLDKEHIYASTSGGGTLWLFIDKTKAPDLNSFKNQLSTNPIKVVCPIRNKQSFECTSIDVMAYDKDTQFVFNGGAINTLVEIKSLNNVVNVISAIKRKLDITEDTLSQMLLELMGKADMFHDHNELYYTKKQSDAMYVNRTPVRIKSGADLNTITKGGNYITEDNIANLPVNSYGRLQVLEWDNSQKWVTQIFYTDMRNEVFTRCTTNAEGSTWSEWRKLSTNADNDLRYFRKDLGNVTDFNLCKTEGMYIVSSENIPNAPFNPNTTLYGKLLVYVRDRDITQMFISHENRIFLRFCNNGSAWGNWTKVFSTFDTPSWNDVKGKPELYTKAQTDDNFVKTKAGYVADFNTAIAPGIWNISGTDIPNAPFGGTIYGSMEVIDRNGDRVQRVMTTSGSMFIRYYAGGGNNIGFRDWIKVYTDTTAPKWSEIRERPDVWTQSQSDNRYPLSYLGTVKDFNNCRGHEGTWLVNSATSLPNAPFTGGIWGTLEILNATVTGEIMQRFTTVTGQTYTRYYHANGVWDKWISNSYRGDVTDFNTCTDLGKYYVYKEGGNIPNAPITGNLYGELTVTKPNESELMQILHCPSGEIYTRLRNFEGRWWDWIKTPTVTDFDGKDGDSYGYQKFPSGVIMQWGSTLITFDGYRAHGYLYYPLSFTRGCHCCGNVATNDYGGYCETSGTVVGDSLTRGYAEALDFESKNENGKHVRIQWIAIGI